MYAIEETRGAVFLFVFTAFLYLYMPVAREGLREVQLKPPFWIEWKC